MPQHFFVSAHYILIKRSGYCLLAVVSAFKHYIIAVRKLSVVYVYRVCEQIEFGVAMIERFNEIVAIQIVIFKIHARMSRAFIKRYTHMSTSLKSETRTRLLVSDTSSNTLANMQLNV